MSAAVLCMSDLRRRPACTAEAIFNPRTLLDLEIVLRGGALFRELGGARSLKVAARALGSFFRCEAALHGSPLAQAALHAGTALARGTVALVEENNWAPRAPTCSSSGRRDLVHFGAIRCVSLGERQAARLLSSISRDGRRGQQWPHLQRNVRRAPSGAVVLSLAAHSAAREVNAQ